MIHIFVGCAANNEDLESQAVLEYSIRKNHPGDDVEIEWMQQSRDPRSFWHGWNTKGWTTPFSGFRWGIPARCKFSGRAIYLDSDMIVVADIAELYGMSMLPGKALVAKGQNERFCCTLFDCARVQSLLSPFDRIKRQAGVYKDQRRLVAKAVQPFPADANWNCCDGEDYASLDDPRIKIHHYTAIDCQPQLVHALKRLEAAGQRHWFLGKPQPHWRADVQPYFDKWLKEARKAGFRVEDYEVEPFGQYGHGTSDGGSWKTGRPAHLGR